MRTLAIVGVVVVLAGCGGGGGGGGDPGAVDPSPFGGGGVLPNAVGVLGSVGWPVSVDEVLYGDGSVVVEPR